MQKLSDTFAASPQISVDDVREIAQAGFKAVVCNRPDHEDPGQPTAAEIEAACAEHDLAFHHVPIVGPQLEAASVDAMRDVMKNTAGPVFAYCRSGTRCAVIWQYATRNP